MRGTGTSGVLYTRTARMAASGGSLQAALLPRKGIVAQRTADIEAAKHRVGQQQDAPSEDRPSKRTKPEETKHTSKLRAENAKLREEVKRLRAHVVKYTTESLKHTAESNALLNQPFVTLKILNCGATDDGGHQWQWTCEQVDNQDTEPLHVDDPDVTIAYWCEDALQEKVKQSISPRSGWNLYVELDGSAPVEPASARNSSTPNRWMLTIYY